MSTFMQINIISPAEEGPVREENRVKAIKKMQMRTLSLSSKDSE